MPKEQPIKQIIRVTILTIESRAHQIYDYQHYQNHITSITYWTSQSPALIIWGSLRGQSDTSGSWHDPTSRHNQLEYITTIRHMHNYFSNTSLIGTSKDSVEVSWPTSFKKLCSSQFLEDNSAWIIAPLTSQNTTRSSSSQVPHKHLISFHEWSWDERRAGSEVLRWGKVFFFLINSPIKHLPLCGVSLFSDSLLEALKPIT